MSQATWLALGAVLATAAMAWPFTVDDAFVLTRFAENILGGEGYAMNPGGRPSDGITGPAWLVVYLVAALGPGPALVKAVGLACSLAAIVAWGDRLRGRAQGRAAWAFAALVLACGPDLGVWSVAGLETGAAVLLVTIATLEATAQGGGGGAGLGLALGALAWLRPELAFFGLTLLAAVALWKSARALRAAMFALPIVSCLLVGRLWLFGDALPLSFYAKPADLENGVLYLARFAVVGTSVAGIALATVGALGGRLQDRIVGAALLAHVLAVALAGGDWMPGFRLMVPLLPLYAVLAGLGAARIARRRPFFALLAVALACSLPVLDLCTRIPEVRAAARSRERAGKEIADFLRDHAHRFAAVDIGYLSLASGLPVVDLGGITDPHVAHAPGGHLDKRIEEDWLRDQDPDAIVLHSRTPPRVRGDGAMILDGYPVERRVAAMSWVRHEFRHAQTFGYAPGYIYSVLLRFTAESDR